MILISKKYGDASRGEISLDENDNIYVTASTTSSDFPATNCTTCSKAGGQDAVIFKLNNLGTNLLWSNYYGSTDLDAGYSIKVANGTDIYVAARKVVFYLQPLAPLNLLNKE